MSRLEEIITEQEETLFDWNGDGWKCYVKDEDTINAIKQYATECIKASLEKVTRETTMFKICDKCNTEFPVLNVVSSMQTCPCCGKSNHIWTRINKQSITNPENIVLL